MQISQIGIFFKHSYWIFYLSVLNMSSKSVSKMTPSLITSARLLYSSNSPQARWTKAMWALNRGNGSGTWTPLEKRKISLKRLRKVFKCRRSWHPERKGITWGIVVMSSMMSPSLYSFRDRSRGLRIVSKASDSFGYLSARRLQKSLTSLKWILDRALMTLKKPT